MASITTLGLNSNSKNTSKNSSTMQEQISKQAYQFYIERGSQDGFDHDDWLRAEKIVRGGA